MDPEIIARHIQLLSKTLSVESLPEDFKEAGKRIPTHAFTTGGGKEVSLEEASVFSVVPRGNIITSVYATAEKASNLIKEDWRER
jgi:hypothetical protein